MRVSKDREYSKYKVEVCFVGSDLIIPHKEAPSSAQGKVGTDADNIFTRGTQIHSLQVDAGVKAWLWNATWKAESELESVSK